MGGGRVARGLRLQLGKVSDTTISSSAGPRCALHREWNICWCEVSQQLDIGSLEVN